MAQCSEPGTARLDDVNTWDHVAQIRRGAGITDAIDIQLVHGLSLRLLPGRGLDVGPAWFAGVPLHWSSSLGETPSISEEDWRDGRWLENFGGGLVTTCGLRNVGPASGGQPMHGYASLTAAQDVEVSRHVDNGTLVVSVTGVVRDGPIKCRRTVTSTIGSGRLEIHDLATNDSASAEIAPLLYHVNFGAPFLGPTTRVEIASQEATPRDPCSRLESGNWTDPWSVSPAHEVVLEHRLAPSAPSRASVAGADGSIVVRLSWTGLTRLHQWIDMGPSRRVVAIEPANCSLLGRAADAAEGTAPWLQPGETRETTLTMEMDANEAR